jgi:long-chain acyl-CoA synthetase
MASSIIEILSRHSINIPDKICLIDGAQKLTYSEYFCYIYGFSEFLKEDGVKNGDHVVVRTSQSSNFFGVGAAIQLAGAIFVPVEKKVSKIFLDEIIDITKAKLIISDANEDVDIDVIKLSEFWDHKAERINYEEIEFPKGTDIAEVLFTTGTTGKSKGVVMNHRSNIALAENVVDGTQMEEDNIEIIPCPYNHSMSIRRYYSNMYNGSTVVTANGVTFVQPFFDSIERNKVTAINLAPAFVSMVFGLSGDKIGEYKDQLKYIQVGGSIFPQADKDRLSKLLPNTRLYDFYGCTESGCACTYDFNKCGEIRNCVGKPTVNATFKFVNEEGNEVAGSEEEPGFLMYGGSMVMNGYFNEPELTAETLKDGMVVSKDLAYRDEDGNIYILGRKDDIINMGGIKISPTEIENIARHYDGIEECACVPTQDQLMGEVPKLFIKVKDKDDLNMRDFKKYLSTNVDQSKMPKYIETIDEFPITYNGKIKRRDLIDM